MDSARRELLIGERAVGLFKNKVGQMDRESGKKEERKGKGRSREKKREEGEKKKRKKGKRKVFFRLEQHISPQYAGTSPLFSSLCPPPFCTAVQRETGRQNAKDEHGHRPTHPTCVTYEYRAVIRG
jgi:hypothetical protein